VRAASRRSMQMIQPDAEFFLHPAISISSTSNSSLEDAEWKISQQLAKRTFKVPTQTLNLLLAFAGGARAHEIAAEFAVPSVSKEQLLQLMNVFVDQDILCTDVNEAAFKRIQNLKIRWHACGWFAACDYHILTYDYPFEDYRKDGQQVDSERMLAYRKRDSEPARAKKCRYIFEEFKAPACADACQALASHCPENEITRDSLLNLAAIVHGVLRTREVTGSMPAQPLLRKTSPSGGCRHPTEAYYFIVDVPGLPKGTYHFSAVTNSLDRLSSLPVEDEVATMFDGLRRAPFTQRLYVILTSVLERNMYRYREPRTYRTVLMDVGHQVGTFEFVAEKMGFKTFCQHGIDDDSIASFLQIDPDVEPPIYGIALGCDGESPL